MHCVVVVVVVVVVATAAVVVVKISVQSSCILRLNQQLMSSRASLRTAGNSRKSWRQNMTIDQTG